MKAVQKLQTEVHDRQLCTLCGSCVDLCPRIKPYKGEIRVIDNCNLDEGRCYAFCPRTSLDLDSLSRAVFGVPFRVTEIGEFKEVMMARTSDTEIKAKAQHGGIVSSLICFALERGYIDSAVLTKSENLVPKGIVASNRADVLRCGGSNFLAAPTLGAFNSAVKEDFQRIGFVGMPCQVLALAKRKVVHFKDDSSIDKLALTIGLLCTWALSYSFRDRVSQVVPLSSVKKMDVPSRAANVFQVYASDGVNVIPLDEVRRFIRPGCIVCSDMTAEFADISVGVARGMPDWNTVLIRTEKGKKLIEEMKNARFIEIGSLSSDSFENLKRASLRKKEGAFREILSRTGNNDDLLYLKLKRGKIKDFVLD